MSDFTDHPGTPETELPPPTAPENLSICLRAFDTEDHARAFGNLVAIYVRALSRQIDLSALDGITIAFDYAQALLDLDRGYATTYKLTPTEGAVIGVAMTPAVIRNGQVKSHMVFHAGVLVPLEDEKHELHDQALHMLAHECAHVEVTDRLDAALPGFLLQYKTTNLHEHCRWGIIKACWDEYAVTQICAPFGRHPTEDYEETFIRALSETRRRANNFIKAYRLHANLKQIMTEVYGAYGELMKFAAYHLGNMAGLGLTLDDLPKTKKALEGHWFEPYFQKLKEVCADIARDYGQWHDRKVFEALGDLADEIVAEGGLLISGHREDGGFWVEIPFTPETMPDGDPPKSSERLGRRLVPEAPAHGVNRKADRARLVVEVGAHRPGMERVERPAEPARRNGDFDLVGILPVDLLAPHLALAPTGHVGGSAAPLARSSS